MVQENERRMGPLPPIVTSLPPTFFLDHSNSSYAITMGPEEKALHLTRLPHQMECPKAPPPPGPCFPSPPLSGEYGACQTV